MPKGQEEKVDGKTDLETHGLPKQQLLPNGNCESGLLNDPMLQQVKLAFRHCEKYANA